MQRPSARTVIGVGGFLALVGVEIWLARSMALEPSIRGYIETRTYSVSSPAKGMVRKLDVSLGEHVTAGQVIAELDSSQIEAEMTVAMARRKQVLAARIAAAGAQRTSGSATPEVALPDDDALHVVDLELEQLAEKRDAMRLKAPTDGVIESIDVRPGDAAQPATPVATVVAADTRRVIACVPENRIGEVEVTRVAHVQAVVGEHTETGVVESVTPAIAPLPQRCQPPFAHIPVLGKQAVILLDRADGFVPGQTALISFTGQRRALPEAGEAGAAEVPELIDVPPEVVAVSRFEASGLVWVASLDRYVVVSDETGVGGSHPPWLFTMSQRGVVDPEPLVIEDVEQLDDLESIAADDRDGLYLLASQSMSERGNRPKAREDLLYVVPSGGGFRTEQRVELAKLLDDAAPDVRAALGITDTRKLDLEGMAWRGGALYLGLKAPLDGDGRALIWKVAAPDKLLAGDLAGAGVTVWAHVALPVDADGAPAHGGIADLLFLSDDTFVVGATVEGAKHQTGALYLVRMTGGAATPTRLRTFPDLRPEGIARTPGGDRLAIVFDRGRDAPMWLELPVPAAPP